MGDVTMAHAVQRSGARQLGQRYLSLSASECGKK